MTNEKLGVLLVDVPEPSFWDYVFLECNKGTFYLTPAFDIDYILNYAFKCTQEEAKNYPQFRWVSLEDL